MISLKTYESFKNIEDICDDTHLTQYLILGKNFIFNLFLSDIKLTSYL